MSDSNAARYEEGKAHSHDHLDPKDQRSIANKLDAEERKEKEAEKPSLASVDPTAPALMHGHKPSKGAQIDKELMEEDEAQLKRKGKA